LYNDKHAELAMAFAAQAATAINNARLFDETQQRNADLAIINSVQEGLASKLAMQEIYELVGEKLREIFTTANLSIGVYDPKTDLLSAPFIVEHGRRAVFPPLKLEGRGIIGRMLKDPKILLYNQQQIQQAMIDTLSVDVTGGGIPKSAMYVPLIVSGAMRGAVVLQDMQKDNAFDEADVRLLETLVDSMSVALENARLWEQEEMFRRALQRELEIGREIQAGFLPDSIPQVQGWEIAAALMSAREVAGDFYDVFELTDGTLGLVIADVCDKGVGAALFMTLFRSLIRITAAQDLPKPIGDSNSLSPACERIKRTMSQTNDYIAETHGRSGMFATLFFGILDPGDGTLTYGNGGHEPPLILQAGGVREYLSKTGPAVGAILQAGFEAFTTKLNPGDILLAFTDGLPEAKNPRDEFFGHERLRDILKQETRSSLELVAKLERELHGYIDTATQFDDITLLAVRRKQ
jgi:serine phosphatase RsbU (regulator of sigma subunit)